MSARLTLKPVKGAPMLSVDAQITHADGSRFAVPTVNIHIGTQHQTVWGGLNAAQARQVAADINARVDEIEAAQ